MKDAVSTFADGVDPITTDTGKIIYRNTTTGIDVVYDIEGDYFRIIDNNITGKRGALDLNGNAIPNNVLTEKGTQRGISQGEYNAASHFNNSDMDFPYDK